MIQDAVNESYSNIQIKKSTDLANDIKLVKFIWAFYLIQIINAVIKIVFDIDDNLWSLLSYVFMIVIIIFLARIIKIIFRRNFSKLILAEGIILILFAISLLMGNANTDILINFFFWTAGVSILLGITYFSIIQKDIFFKYSIRYSNYVLIIGMIGFLFMGKQHVYIMSLAYFMLLPITILINYLFDKFSIRQFLIVATSIALILIFGARGPIVSIIYIIAICFYKSIKRLTYKSMLLTISTIITFIFSMVFWEKIILTIIGLLSGLGIYSRTLYRLAYGGITNLTGRDELFNYYFELIQDKPIIGWGIAGGWIARGAGPHNAIIEIVLAFGVLLGGILSILLVFSFIIPFINRRILSNDIYTAFAAVNLPLIVSSGDIWVKYNFFIYIFVMLELIVHSKKNDNKNL